MMTSLTETPTSDGSIHAGFEHQAARTPNAIAVSAGDQRLTYFELDVKANALAHRLRRGGVGANVLVALCVDRSVEMVIAILAILKAGGAYVPLDPTYPRERLDFMARDSGARVVIADGERGEIFDKRVTVVRLETDSADHAAPAGGASTEDLAYVIYTSGSTGQPKGTLVTHRNVIRLFDATRPLFQFGPSDVWTLFHSYAFDFSVWEMWGALLYGGRLVIVPRAITRSAPEFHELARRERVTVLNQTPSAFRQYMRVDEERSDNGGAPLRLVIFGGEALDLAALSPWFDRYGDSKPQLVNMYGITETTVHVTCRFLHRADVNRKTSAIGSPLSDLRVHILDIQGQPAPVGASGELYVGGAGVARGYLGQPGLTAERFIPDPFGAAGERIYRTGDLGRLRPDGDIEYLGRVDDQVKIRGFRIELGEIESAIVRTGLAREAVVVLQQEERDDKRLVAYVTGQIPPASSVLREALAKTLPDYMVPAAFVTLEAFPLTPSGKVDRRAMPAPATTRELAAEFVPPSSPIEEGLATLWCAALRVDRIGVNENFFDLGGHSLILFQLAGQIADTFGVELPVHVLFDTSTIRDMSLAILERLVEHVPDTGAEELLGELESISAGGDVLLKREGA